ncbi:hypothetical protein TgHK011_003213 [Trichoderma gracile]|nr:hypothetical protein TgHK011_003213 [Trichoderma gracile]
MKFSLFAVAALPALALAQSTTTETSTTVLTKTVTLQKVHTVTSVSSSVNATATHVASISHHLVGTGVTTTYYQPTAPPSTGAPVASATATKGPQNAGVALEASKVALAGVAGMIVVALM